MDSNERIDYLINNGIEVIVGKPYEKSEYSGETRILGSFSDGAVEYGNDLSLVKHLRIANGKISARRKEHKTFLKILENDGIDISPYLKREIKLELHTLETPRGFYQFILPHSKYMREHLTEENKRTPIPAHRLTPTIHAKLLMNGIKTIEDLSRMSESEILKIKGINYGKLQTIRDFLKERGLSLK